MIVVHYPDKFKVKVDSITSTGIVVENELSARLIGEHERTFLDPIYVQMELKRVEHEVAVKGRIKAMVVMECARCLKSFDYEVVKTNFFAYVKIKHHENIDLTGLIREDIIVSLPMRVLCDEQCKGLCSRCGENLNTSSCECSTISLKEKGGAFSDLDTLFNINNLHKDEE